MNVFAKGVNGFKPLTIFAKKSIIDVQLSTEYVSADSLKVILASILMGEYLSQKLGLLFLGNFLHKEQKKVNDISKIANKLYE